MGMDDADDDLADARWWEGLGGDGIRVRGEMG